MLQVGEEEEEEEDFVYNTHDGNQNHHTGDLSEHTGPFFRKFADPRFCRHESRYHPKTECVLSFYPDD
jgi:hypothetical protein